MKDKRGVDASSDNSRNLEIYERALRAFNTYRCDPVAIIDNPRETEPGFAMGHVLCGHVLVSMWEKSVVTEIETSVAMLNGLGYGKNDRERRHAHALQRWTSGDWNGARGTLACAE